MAPPLIAHRGRFLPNPENVIPSLEAMPPWVDGVEIDVRLTSDSVPILMHDSTVNRTTNGSGPVDSFTLAQIQALDAGGGAQVPRLVDYLDAIETRNAGASAGQRPISIILVDMIGNTVGIDEAYAVVDAHNLRGLCMFMFRFLTTTVGAEALRVLDATIPMGTFSLPLDEVDTQVANMQALNATIVYTGGPNWLRYSSSLLSQIHAAGFELGVSTGILTAVVSAHDKPADAVISDEVDRLSWWHAPSPEEQRPVVTRVISGSHTPTFEARIVTEFQTTHDPEGVEIPILDGDVQYDGTADVFATVQLTTAGTDETTGRSLRPRRGTDLFAPYGPEVWLQRGIDLGSEILWVPLGFFRLTATEQSHAPFGPIRLSGQDRMRGIIRSPLLAPRAYAPDTTVGEVVIDLVSDVYPEAIIGFDDDTYLTEIGRQLVVERNRYAVLREIADSYGKIMYWDGLGILRIEDLPAADELVWEVRSGRDGVLVQPSTAMSDTDAVNAMVVTGQGVSGLVSSARGVAIDLSPNSPTRFGGPAGQAPEFFESPLVLEDEQASAAAVALLRRRIGMSHTAEFQAVVNPLLRPWQAVRTTLQDGSRDKHVMEQYSVPLTASASARGATREQTRINVQAVTAL